MRSILERFGGILDSESFRNMLGFYLAESVLDGGLGGNGGIQLGNLNFLLLLLLCKGIKAVGQHRKKKEKQV